MVRKITPEERAVLTENPELVMFDPYSAFKTHRSSLGKALALPASVALFLLLWGILFPGHINAHPGLFAGVGCAALIFASGALPILYLLLDNRTFRKAKAEHYAKQLKLLLPQNLVCRVVRVQWVICEKAEGVWLADGTEEGFGFSSFVNCFRIEPDSDLAVISGGEKFLAFVKRDIRTESFYQDP